MITYRFLSDVRTENLHTAFRAAFADYQVDMRMSLNDFEYRLLRDGVRPEICAGAFVNDQLVAFTLNAGGTWQGKETVYDAGTGVLPEYRGRRIATELFEFMLPTLKDFGFDQYLLEVLTSNEKAVHLYRNLGFTDTRRFAVFRVTTRVTTTDADVVKIRDTVLPNWGLYKSFWSGYPSWQNSIDAIQRVANTVVVLEAHINDRCVGYGVVSEPSGSLFQLAVHSEYRRRGVGSTLLTALQRRVVTGESIKVNNVDEGLKETTSFFKARGFNVVLEQYELCLQI